MAALWLSLFVSIASLVLGIDEAYLLFVGDAMQHQAQLDAARSSGGYDYSQSFADITPLVTMADYAVVNLETPVGPPPHSGYPCFNAPEAFVDALKGAGFDLMLTANNHTLDRGHRGLRSTVGVLDSRGLAHTGTYACDSARAASVPLLTEINGFKVSFLNYTYGTNGISPRDGVVVDYIDRERMKADVEAARAAGAEIVAMCIHWGDEYKLLPNNSQRLLADFVEALGVDMLIGGHPHVIQPMEFRPNRYYPEKQFVLVYSLGNFISNMKTPDTRGGAMVHVGLGRGTDGRAKLTRAEYRLLFTVPGTRPSDNFRVLEADSVPAGPWRGRAEDFMRRARAVFDKHNVGVAEVRP